MSRPYRESRRKPLLVQMEMGFKAWLTSRTATNHSNSLASIPTFQAGEDAKASVVTSNKCIASSNKCLTSSNNKLVETMFGIFIPFRTALSSTLASFLTHVLALWNALARLCNPNLPANGPATHSLPHQNRRLYRPLAPISKRVCCTPLIAGNPPKTGAPLLAFVLPRETVAYGVGKACFQLGHRTMA